MIAQLAIVEAFIARAIQLDESWNQGALPEFLINLEAARSGIKPKERAARIEAHYQRALALSRAERPSLFVTYAENQFIPAQNRARFEELVRKALEVDPSRHPETRLATLIAQRRARWLLGRADELFLEPAAPAAHKD